MTDAIIIQTLSRFAACQVCPSLGYTRPCCPLPAWLHADSSRGQVSLQGSWWATGNLTCLHLYILGTCSCPISRAKGEGHLFFSGHSCPEPCCPPLLPAPKRNHANPGSPLRKTKHAIHHTNTSFPALLLLWSARFVKAALPLHCLCTTSQAAHPKPWAPPPTAPATAQPSTRCWQDLLPKALSPKAPEQLSPHPRTTSAVLSNTRTQTYVPYVLLSPLKQQHQFWP